MYVRVNRMLGGASMTRASHSNGLHTLAGQYTDGDAQL